MEDFKLRKEILEADKSLSQFLEQALDDYSSNDFIAWIDDAWKCIAGEDDGQTFYRNKDRHFTDAELIDEIKGLTERVVSKALSDHFKRIENVVLNK